MGHSAGFEESDELVESYSNNISTNSNNHQQSLDRKEEFDKELQKEIAGHHEEEALVAQEQLFRQEETGEIRPISKKPLPRALLVLVFVGGVIGVLGLLWAGFFAPRPVRREGVVSSPAPTLAPTQDESAVLKANLAFQDQRRAVESVSAPAPSTTVQQSPAVKTTASTRAPVPPSVRYVQSPPRVITRTVQAPPQVVTRTVTRIVPAPPPPRQQSEPERLPALAVVQPKLNPGTTTAPVDPMERWATLAKLGQIQGENKERRVDNSLSSTPAVELNQAPQSTPLQSVPQTTPSSQFQPNIQSPNSIPTITIEGTEPTSIETDKARFGNPVFNAPKEQSNSGTNKDIVDTVSSTGSVINTRAVTESKPQLLQETIVASPVSFYTAAPKQLTEGEAGILNRARVNFNGIKTTKEIPIGSSVSGRIIVPMMWNEAGQEPTKGRAAVELSKDLIAIDGTVGLPKGTILIVQPSSIASNRMASLSAVAIVFKDSEGRTRQQEIPSGMITINGKGNQPLIAQGYFDPGPDVAKQDMLVGTLSGLGKVGEVINRPRSSTVFNSSTIGSSQTTTSTTSDPNVLAAVLEGFFGTTAQRLAQRSDRATQELLRRPNIDVVPQGTEVTVFINAFIKIRR